MMGFLGGTSGKESACNAGNPGSIPGLGRSPGGAHGNPFQYSCLENPMDRGAWRATVHRVTKSWTWLKWLSMAWLTTIAIKLWTDYQEKMCGALLLHHVQRFVTLWTVACQVPPSTGFFQARILEWVAISFSRVSSQPRDRTWVSCTAGILFTVWATRKALPVGASGKESTCQCRSHKRQWSDPWVGKIPWRRAWQPTPVLLPGESHGQRSLAGYSP